MWIPSALRSKITVTSDSRPLAVFSFQTPKNAGLKGFMPAFVGAVCAATAANDRVRIANWNRWRNGCPRFSKLGYIIELPAPGRRHFGSSDASLSKVQQRPLGG